MARRLPRLPEIDGYDAAYTKALLAPGDTIALYDYRCAACGLYWAGPVLTQCPNPFCLSRDVRRARGQVLAG
jgi:hypothetical protein